MTAAEIALHFCFTFSILKGRIREGTEMTTVRRAMATDAATLAAVAAVTFPLACPLHTTEQAKAEFIDEYLGEGSFSGYIADPLREVLLAEIDGEPVGYSMLVAGEPHDPEVAASITARPTVEISKCYVMPEHHGQGLRPRRWRQASPRHRRATQRACGSG